MKTFLTGFALLICVHIKAQTITPAASAQECITFIENTLRAILFEDPRFKNSISFKGAELVDTQEYPGGSIYSDNRKNIDWSKFDSLSRIPSQGNTAIMFNFSVAITNISTRHYKGSLVNTEVEHSNYLHFVIRQSDTARIKELEKAAKRLSQIALAKESPLLALKPVKIPLEGKPTYKQTVSFIKSYFNTDARREHNFLTTAWYEAGYLNTLSYKMLYVEIADCILYIGYETLRTNHFSRAETKNVVNYKIDISKLEDLKVQVTGTKDREIKEQHFVNHIAFKIADNPAIMLLPFDGLPADAPNNGTQTQIFKAFNQLKKLCGAPEPVVFE